MSVSLKEEGRGVTCILTDSFNNLEMQGKRIMALLVTRLQATTLINVSSFLTSVNPHL
jgi:hypothetical protein